MKHPRNFCALLFGSACLISNAPSRAGLHAASAAGGGTVEFAEFVDVSRHSHYRRRDGGPSPPVAPETRKPLSGRKVIVPMVYPIIGPTHWRNGFNDNRGSYRHTAIDIAARKMQPVVAPFSGIVGFKTQTFWIIGDNGYKCLGTHLNDDTPGRRDNRAARDFMFAPNIRPGDHVIAGQHIGYVGDSGNATGPHLHFELFDRDGVLINPCASLKVAYVMHAPRPAPARAAEALDGIETHLEGCFRKWSPSARALTVLLTTRQTGGKYCAASVPRWYQLTLTPEMVEEAGGDAALRSLPKDRPILFVESRPGSDSPHALTCGSAHRLILPARAPSSNTVAAAPIVAPEREPRPQPEPERQPTPPPPVVDTDSDVAFDDFEERNFDGWTLQGDCWTDAPADESTYRGAIRGFHRDGFLCSFHPSRGGAATGSAISKEFTITRRYINFLIAGGQIPGEECINLAVEGHVVKTGSGGNRRTLHQMTWDVQSYIGRRARLVILDRSENPGLGYTAVDDITFTAQPAVEPE